MEDMLWKFPHVGEQIFTKLSNKNLAKCKKISRSWDYFITNEKFCKQRVLRQCLVLQIPCTEIRASFSSLKRERKTHLMLLRCEKLYKTYIFCPGKLHFCNNEKLIFYILGHALHPKTFFSKKNKRNFR